jgi:FdhD protein
MFASSSCGVCGKASIEQVRLFGRPVERWTIEKRVAASLTDSLRQHQPTFDATGGLHAAGLFDVGGRLIAAREDVGRHNAVDKVIGAATQLHWPLPPCVLVVSGRQSFEVVQKAALAGIGGLIGVSAPSSLAVELARETGMLLIGFSRGESFNVYAGEDRLVDKSG